ncbi:uroporphyrinogen-III synthase [Amnibacterium endophyticum]|uniref:Uroporphyrinogen-III synthase n=1 Tax=Amnibacterium endophyticum TaxID=2109337 RepID=A0ABW4LHN1_9MICO
MCTTPASGPAPRPLEGFRIGVTADRRSADLVDALRRRGAEVLHAPTVRMAPAEDEAAVLAETQAIVAARPRALLATTSYGIGRWFEVADAHGLGEELLDALRPSAVLVRGPKARGGVRAAGLEDEGISERETTESLIDLALQRFVQPVVFAVQQHGFTDEAQLDRLRAAGHTVLPVTPYRWLAPDAADDRVERLLTALVAGALDAVTFTSAPAAEALLHLAASSGRDAAVLARLRDGPLVAAVGPVTAEPLVRAGVPVVWPDRFRMGALIRLVADRLERERVLRVESAFGAVELRGSVLRVAGERVPLSPTGLALLKALLVADGQVLSREQLSAAAPGPLDDRALEVALSRLRRSMPHPELIQTVIKRGYRLQVA